MELSLSLSLPRFRYVNLIWNRKNPFFSPYDLFDFSSWTRWSFFLPSYCHRFSLSRASINWQRNKYSCYVMNFGFIVVHSKKFDIDAQRSSRTISECLITTIDQKKTSAKMTRKKKTRKNTHHQIFDDMSIVRIGIRKSVRHFSLLANSASKDMYTQVKWHFNISAIDLLLWVTHTHTQILFFSDNAVNHVTSQSPANSTFNHIIKWRIIRRNLAIRVSSICVINAWIFVLIVESRNRLIYHHHINHMSIYSTNRIRV